MALMLCNYSTMCNSYTKESQRIELTEKLVLALTLLDYLERPLYHRRNSQRMEPRNPRCGFARQPQRRGTDAADCHTIGVRHTRSCPGREALYFQA